MDYRALFAAADARRAAYSAAKPFPSIAFDDFLPDRFLKMALEGIPPSDSQVWKVTENEHTVNKGVAKYARQLDSALWFNEPAMRLFAELFSPPFLNFLRLLTGIHGLLPDPYFVEGGFHQVGNGGKLDAHADFSHHPFGLERRLNLLLYLNPDWREEYGGHIQLFDANKRPVNSLLPILNRCLIFSTSATSFHGHPEPMVLPEGVYRRSMALYFYTMPRPEREKKRIIFQ